MELADRIVDLIARKPGLTERQMAIELYGDKGVQQQVNSTCRKLLKEGLVQRVGLGGGRQPFTYKIRGAKNA
jgi:predicted transcriptional regulator